MKRKSPFKYVSVWLICFLPNALLSQSLPSDLDKICTASGTKSGLSLTFEGFRKENYDLIMSMDHYGVTIECRDIQIGKTYTRPGIGQVTEKKCAASGKRSTGLQFDFISFSEDGIYQLFFHTFLPPELTISLTQNGKTTYKETFDSIKYELFYANGYRCGRSIHGSLVLKAK